MLKAYRVFHKIYYNDSLIDSATEVVLTENPIESKVTNGPYKVMTTSIETDITMRELMDLKTDLVIQYLKERDITACPMNF